MERVDRPHAVIKAIKDIKYLTVTTTTVSIGSITTIFSGGQEFYLGFLHNLTANTINGSLDEFSVWNVFLSADNIEWLYNSGAGRTYAMTGPYQDIGTVPAAAVFGGADTLNRVDSGVVSGAGVLAGADLLIRAGVQRRLTLPERSTRLTLPDRRP